MRDHVFTLVWACLAATGVACGRSPCDFGRKPFEPASSPPAEWREILPESATYCGMTAGPRKLALLDFGEEPNPIFVMAQKLTDAGFKATSAPYSNADGAGGTFSRRTDAGWEEVGVSSRPPKRHNVEVHWQRPDPTKAHGGDGNQ